MKKILLAVCGTTPQIITETLYALWEHGQLPDSIVILTTKAGRDKLHTALLHAEHGYFYKFCKEYDIDAHKIDFSWKSILVPIDNNGYELDDIRTEEDSSIFLKLCLEQAFDVTAYTENTVYFSIAAGRKTMGASLTLAAQYYGRKQDRLYHVLVQSEFEYSNNFYYPPKKAEVIELKNSDGEKFYKSTEYAKIALTRIPFVSIREKLSNNSLKRAVLPEEVLSQIEATTVPLLKLNKKNCTITWNNITITLQAAWFSLYLYFVNKKLNAVDECELSFTVELDDILDNTEELRNIYNDICKYMPQKEIPTSDTGIYSLNQENFRSYKSRIDTSLKKHFGDAISKDLKISSFGKRPNTRYGILLPASRIEIENE